MEKYVKTNGILMIIVASANVIFELFFQSYMIRSGNREILFLQSVSGIVTKNLFCFFAGVLALRGPGKGGFRTPYFVVLAIAFLVASVVMLTTQGTFPQRVDALINFYQHPYGHASVYLDDAEKSS